MTFTKEAINNLKAAINKIRKFALIFIMLEPF